MYAVPTRDRQYRARGGGEARAKGNEGETKSREALRLHLPNSSPAAVELCVSAAVTPASQSP